MISKEEKKSMPTIRKEKIELLGGEFSVGSVNLSSATEILSGV